MEATIRESARLFDSIARDRDLCDKLRAVCDLCTDACAFSGGKIVFAGNGGSASQAEHLAAEFIGKFYLERPSIPALSLTGPSATITATANDYGYENVFVRQAQSLLKKEDVVIGLTTSGRSLNLYGLFEYARGIGAKTVLMTGGRKTGLWDLSSIVLSIPSVDVPRIQEAHILLGHIIAETVERNLYG